MPQLSLWGGGSPALLLLLTCANLVAATPSFVSAKPIWPKGRETEKNLTVGFRASFKAPLDDKVLLRATGATLYRVYLNGHFLGHGPARGPHGFFRVDEWDLADKLQPGLNVVAFEVTGYNINSYSLLDQPSFLQAEVVAGGKVLASTEGSGASFTATILKERVQKVQRYSFQRPFSEVYRLAPGFDRWRADAAYALGEARVAVQPLKALLPRRVAHPDYVVRQPSWLVSQGQLRTGLKVQPSLEGPLAHRHRPEARRLPGKGARNRSLPRAANHCKCHQPSRQPTLDAGRIGNSDF